MCNVYISVVQESVRINKYVNSDGVKVKIRDFSTDEKIRPLFGLSQQRIVSGCEKISTCVAFKIRYESHASLGSPGIS